MSTEQTAADVQAAIARLRGAKPHAGKNGKPSRYTLVLRADRDAVCDTCEAQAQKITRLTQEKS